MAAYDVIFELAGPLLVGEPRQGNTYTSYTYLPGSVLRGAVAAVLMADWPDEEREKSHPEQCADPARCDFCRVFAPRNGRAPRFYDCYPVWGLNDVVFPFPATARSCKRHPGFRYENDPDDHHGIFDTLIHQAAARDALQSNQTLPYIYTAECPVCAQALTPPAVDHYGFNGSHYYTAVPQNRRFSRTAINRRRHTAQSGQLFTLAVMGEQTKISIPEVEEPVLTRLKGVVDGGDADLELLKKALEQIGWLGSGTSRGLGQVSHCEVRPQAVRQTDTPQDHAADLVNGRFHNLLTQQNCPPLVRRIAAFNQAITAERDFYNTLGTTGVLNGRWYFTIDLLSHTYLRHQGLPTLQLTADMLNLGGTAVDFVAVESIERGGWSDAWGLPRSRQIGAARGSVYLFRVDSDNLETTAALLQRLTELEQEGIGSNRERGAGRLLVCAPFHTEVNPK